MKHEEALRYFRMAREHAATAPDLSGSRKTACILVTLRNNSFADKVVIKGRAGFPQNVRLLPARQLAPTKYVYCEHAERNAIYEAARRGVTTWLSTMYLPWYPCAECARAIVQAGIAELHCTQPDWSETRYGFRDAEAILTEGGVRVIYVPVAAQHAAK